jgi:CRISPR-associated protein
MVRGRFGVEGSEEMPATGDLLVVTLPGVQRFIAESRSTADLHSASAIMAELAGAMIRAASDAGVDVVLPTGGAGSKASAASAARALPNRVVAVTEPGKARPVAESMARAAVTAWRGMVSDRLGGGEDGAGDLATPGFPASQWVAIPAAAGDYKEQWDKAVSALAARKRTRDFGYYRALGRPVCTLTGRWAAHEAGAGVGRADEALSVVAAVKRSYREGSGLGFPSTASLASASFRADLLRLMRADGELRRRIAELRAAVVGLTGAVGAPVGRSDLPALSELAAPGDDLAAWLARVEGAWCYPDTWDPSGLRRDLSLAQPPAPSRCGAGRAAALAVGARARDLEVAALSPYLAVITQDADHMGRALGEPPDRSRMRRWHGAVSAALIEAGRAQVRRLRSPQIIGREVYAGGDDLLGFAPLRTALAAAGAVNEAFRGSMSATVPNLTASAAVVFFHTTTPLPAVVQAAGELLKQAKRNGRPGFGVAVVQRGGERVRAVLPWATRRAGDGAELAAAELLGELVDALDEDLSGRLATRLERDAEELVTLPTAWQGREVRRLVGRHGGSADLGATLLDLARHDKSLPSRLALIARFLGSESR